MINLNIKVTKNIEEKEIKFAKAEVVYENVFENNEILEKVKFNKHVTLKENAFKNCVNIKNIDLENGANIRGGVFVNYKRNNVYMDVNIKNATINQFAFKNNNFNNLYLDNCVLYESSFCESKVNNLYIKNSEVSSFLFYNLILNENSCITFENCKLNGYFYTLLEKPQKIKRIEIIDCNIPETLFVQQDANTLIIDAQPFSKSISKEVVQHFIKHSAFNKSNFDNIFVNGQKTDPEYFSTLGNVYETSLDLLIEQGKSMKEINHIIKLKER